MIDMEDFVVQSPKKNKGENVRIGFQGYGKCEGLGLADFYSEGLTEFQLVSDQPKIEFQVSAVLEFSKNGK